MKLDGMKCPHCGSYNTYTWHFESASIHDDSIYEAQEKESVENRMLSKSADNVVYRCKCADCGKYFASMALLEVKTKKVISRETLEDVMSLKVSEVES